jgi:FAD synthetase
MNKNRVLVFGTYDLLHKGHEHHFRKAAKYGEVYVIVARDKTVREMKRKTPLHSEKERLLAVKKSSFIYRALLGNKTDKYAVIDKINPEVICLGYDQTHFTKNLKSELAKRGLSPRIVRFRKAYKPHIYKTSKIRKKMNLES